MAFIVTESCIKCKHTDCVEVCPVDCFYEGPNFLVIHPDECIDCALCEPECPVDAIFSEDELPDDQIEFIEINAKLPDHKTQHPSSKIKFVNKPVNLNTYKEEARNWITFYASEGTTVFSADAGEVIISGPDIPGYGNMIIIKHPKGILSVYAHLNKSLVSKGDTVTSNQPIASVGKSESSVSMLKFQLRKGDSSISTKDYKFL